MTRWLDDARAALAAGPAALITVLVAEGSTPRGAGTKMVVSRAGQWGTIGGGNLEFMAVKEARRLLAAGGGHAIQDYPLGPLLAQCCGGYVRILVERLGPWIDDLDAGRPAGIVTRIEDGVADKIAEADLPFEAPDGPVVLLDKDGGLLTGAKARSAEAAYIVERPFPPRPKLFMYGAGHTGHALAPIMGTLDFDITWLDDRADVFPGDVAENIKTECLEDLAAFARTTPPGALHLVFTHSHAQDYDVTAALLARDDILYCGLIGSATKRARFEKRYREDGLAEDAIARLTCPIGAGRPKGKDPRVIAIAVAAELLTVVEDSQAT